jgi:hypothetical protein
MIRNTNLGLAVASGIFAIFGLVHLSRMIKPFSIAVAGTEISTTVSALIASVALLLAYWLWTLRK